MSDRAEFLSTLPAGRRQRQLALAVVLVSSVIFLGLVPVAKTPLGPVWAFIPIYQSALVVNDLITAVLLFGQFNILRSRALVVLAGGYLFTGLMAIAHALTFPGLFADTGLLGAGSQSTAWLYMFWHGGFPLAVIGYAWLMSEGRPSGPPRAGGRTAILGSMAAAFVLTGTVTLLATAGADLLPAIMRGHHYTPAMIGVVSSTWMLSLLALIILWRRRPHSVLDVWLMVVMCAWLFDIALAAVLNAGRFDLGFYAGRIYGLLAASFVLVVLLLENGLLYARLAQVSSDLDRQNRSLEQIVAERTQRLLQSEKVATMGALLAGVSHELNNPLAIVMAHAQLLRQTARDASVQPRAEKILAAAERCARIVKNFLALARQRPPERGDVDVNAVIREAIEMLAYELRTDNIEVECDLAAPLPRLWADRHQLHQVLVNLVTNAHHAMRKGPGPRRLRVATQLTGSAPRVRLTISDTGPGIPAEVRGKIFEPFFTTKPAGEGTGLGLSLCRNIIEEHSGTIAADSHPGQGATFVIELPVAERRTRAAGDETVESLPPIGAKRILVIDDEPDIADALGEILKQDGHHVDTASEGLAGLDLLGRRSYDLVLTDTKMPGLDGMGLFREVERRFPLLKGRLIFITGDLLSRDKRDFLESSGAPCLTKPFDVVEVRRLVHRMLSPRPAP